VSFVDPAQRETFLRDGVVCLHGVLDARALALAQRAYEWSLANPSPSANSYGGGGGRFYQDLANRKAQPVYRELVHESPAADLAAALFGAPDVWFMYEQVFLKEGGDTRRTPWHQDSSYLPIEGEQIVVLWISFDPVPRENALEFVRGSQRGPLYDGSRFDPEDDTSPLYGDGSLPRLPNIETEREKWDVIGYAVEPGDVVAFHPALLHGGAVTHAGQRRRTLSLRFFGADAVYAKRPLQTASAIPEARATSVFQLLPGRLAIGEPFRHPEFPKVRPRPNRS
jgi:ectoine hydroxylase-related dioxygenase (phytanoyl-CoA dioxygenase family)